MSRVLSKLAILLLIIIFPLIVSATDNNPKPQIVSSTELIDIGKVKSTEVKQFFLTLQNSGQSDLVIKSVTVDCPCTTFQFLTKDEIKYLPLTISMGEKTEVKVIFDASKTIYRGKFTKLILISSNDPNEPIGRVKMVGEIGD